MADYGFPQMPRTASATELAKQALETQIRDGVLRSGERLPTEPELASRLGVSRNSLREALKSLEDLGLVTKRHGVGTFVTESRPLVQGGIERLTSLMEFIEGEGRVPGSALINSYVVPAGPEVARRLGLDPEASVAVIESLKTADGYPVAVCVDYIPTDYLDDEYDPALIQDAIFEGLQREFGINIKFAECEIVPITAHESLAEMLMVDEGTALLLLDQVHMDDRDRRVFHSKSYFPFNRFAFRLIRHR